jgi:hypothetical protein
MEQKKKLTNAQLQRRMQTAIVFVPKDKDAIDIYFSDKGLRLTATSEKAIISFAYSQTVYENWTTSGVSRPCLYTKRVIEIANEHLEEIKTDNGYSFQRLLDVLNKKEDKAEYNIVTYYDWFIFNLFQPQFGIAEDEVSSFLVYEDYIHNIARNAILLGERNVDVTNKQFFDMVIERMKEFVGDLEESVLLHKKSDEEVMKENIEAAQEQELNDAMEAQVNGASKD